MRKFDVMLVGEFNLDLVFYGLPETLPTEHELLASDMALLLGGSTAITAHNLARLGNRVGLIAPTANDLLAGFCTRELEQGGVDLLHAVAAPRRCGKLAALHMLICVPAPHVCKPAAHEPPCGARDARPPHRCAPFPRQRLTSCDHRSQAVDTSEESRT